VGAIRFRKIRNEMRLFNRDLLDDNVAVIRPPGGLPQKYVV
jgi:hypothetical protein